MTAQFEKKRLSETKSIDKKPPVIKVS